MSQCPFSKIPGKGDLPFFQDTLSFIREEPNALVERKRAKFGDVHKVNVFNRDSVVVIKENFTRWALIENSKNLYSREAWETVLKELFPNGLMLMDGERHRSHRSVIAEVFKKEPMEGYLEMMIPIVDRILGEIEDEYQKMFPFFKELTLKVALEVFFGLSPKDDLSKINTAITDIVKASASLRINLPFTTYGKGLRARKYLVAYFNNLVKIRRQNPGKDLFSKLCFAESEEGQKFTDQEVIDHLIFILMAAHDTTASTLTSLTYFLAKNENWQEKIREESKSINTEEISLKSLKSFENANIAIKETLRIYPPLTSVTRVSNKDISFEEYNFPKGTFFSIPISYFQKMKEIWSQPDKWEPNRFSKEVREDKKCPYAYSPFGAGLHHCIGSSFAEMQMNLVIGKMLQKFNLVLPDSYEIPMKGVPLHEPKDGLPMKLKLRN